MRITLILALALWLTACGDSKPATKALQPVAPVSLGPADVARQTLVQATDVEADSITIVSVETVEFSDSSLGCPQPDMAYLAVITPGHKVIAEAAGKSYDIRINGQHGLVCSPAPQAFPKR